MPIPTDTSNVASDQVISAWLNLRKGMGLYRNILQAAKDDITGGSPTANQIIERLLSAPKVMGLRLANDKARLISPEGVQFIKDQRKDQGYNIVGELAVFENRLEAIDNWLQANFPKNVDGDFDQGTRIDPATGRSASKVFGSGEMDPLIPLINAALAAIE